MTVTSKYNKGDNVYFKKTGKYYIGVIIDIISWEPAKGFLYTLARKMDNSKIDELFYESDLYSSKEEVIETIFIID